MRLEWTEADKNGGRRMLVEGRICEHQGPKAARHVQEAANISRWPKRRVSVGERKGVRLRKSASDR